METARLGGRRRQRQHAVTTIDIKALGDWAELMGRIDFAVAVRIIPQTIVAVFAAVADFVAKVMLVAAFRMNEFAEEALLHHVENGQLFAAIAAVFQQHARLFRPFARADQLPALFDGCRAADFRRGIFASVHGRDANIRMGGPRRRRNNGIQLLHVQKSAEIRARHRRVAALLDHVLLRTGQAVFIQIRNADDFHIRHPQQQSQKPAAAAAHTDNCYTHSIHSFLPPIPCESFLFRPSCKNDGRLCLLFHFIYIK